MKVRGCVDPRCEDTWRGEKSGRRAGGQEGRCRARVRRLARLGMNMELWMTSDWQCRL
jgi:hypothetical protein